jgi:hypothetical protein
MTETQYKIRNKKNKTKSSKKSIKQDNPSHDEDVLKKIKESQEMYRKANEIAFKEKNNVLMRYEKLESLNDELIIPKQSIEETIIECSIHRVKQVRLLRTYKDVIVQAERIESNNKMIMRMLSSARKRRLNNVISTPITMQGNRSIRVFEDDDGSDNSNQDSDSYDNDEYNSD